MNITLISHRYGVPLGDPCVYPLGFLYISSVLKQAGHNVKILNYNLWDYGLESELAGQELVMFTGFEEFSQNIKKDAEICKNLGIKTAVGGALATFRHKKMAEHCDIVVRNEAESIICDILDKKGVFYGGNVKLSTIPYPDYDGFGIREYHKRNGFKHVGVLTSRGCPHRCTFCSHTCQFQYRGLSDVFNEIDLYRRKYEVELVVFNDNTLNTNKRRFIDIAKGMDERKLKWSAAIRLDVLDDEMCIAMKGYCHGLVVGVESFSQRILDALQKRLTVSQIIDGLDLLHRHNIPYYGNVLFGFDGQTDREIYGEYCQYPKKYNLFPALVRPFIGTSEGRNSGLSYEEWVKWDNVFKENVRSRGKYCYPDLKGVE